MTAATEAETEKEVTPKVEEQGREGGTAAAEDTGVVVAEVEAAAGVSEDKSTAALALVGSAAEAAKNNRYTNTHRFVGITRRAPGDTRSNATRPWRAQVNHMGKAHRAPGNFETPEEAAQAYDTLVRSLGLVKERPVNFPQEGEIPFDRAVCKHAGGRKSRKLAGGGRGMVMAAAGPMAMVNGGNALGVDGMTPGKVPQALTAEEESNLLEARIGTLKGLHDKGLIDKEEYTSAKMKVLDNFAAGQMQSTDTPK